VSQKGLAKKKGPKIRENRTKNVISGKTEQKKEFKFFYLKKCHKKITKNFFIYFSQKSMNGFFQFFCFPDFLRPFYNQIRQQGYYSMGNLIFYHNPIRKFRKNIVFGRLEAKHTFL
jgi:hypothetical protein